MHASMVGEPGAAAGAIVGFGSWKGFEFGMVLTGGIIQSFGKSKWLAGYIATY